MLSANQCVTSDTLGNSLLLDLSHFWNSDAPRMSPQLLRLHRWYSVRGFPSPGKEMATLLRISPVCRSLLTAIFNEQDFSGVWGSLSYPTKICISLPLQSSNWRIEWYAFWKCNQAILRCVASESSHPVLNLCLASAYSSVASALTVCVGLKYLFKVQMLQPHNISLSSRWIATFRCKPTMITGTVTTRGRQTGTVVRCTTSKHGWHQITRFSIILMSFSVLS